MFGDVGGFGAGSQLWPVAGLLGYQVNKRFTLQAGYRYLDVNYRSTGFKYARRHDRRTDTSTSSHLGRPKITLEH